MPDKRTGMTRISLGGKFKEKNGGVFPLSAKRGEG